MEISDTKLLYRLAESLRLGKFSFQRAGGQTNRNYIVSSQGRKFFVRLPWESVLDRKTEGKNILALSRSKKLKDILPKYNSYILKKKNILDSKGKDVFSVPDGTMVVEYVTGREFTTRDFRKEVYQKQLAKMFRVFHTSGVRLVNEYDVFRDEIARYRVAVEKYPVTKIISKEDLIQIKEIERKAQQELPLSKKGISTHNDFLLQNFLVGSKRKVYLLDFEYAGFNIRGGISYDFGFFFADNLFRKPAITKKLFEEFLQVVEKEYGKQLNRKQIYWSAVAALLVQVWWGILRYLSVKTRKEKKYFQEYIQKRSKGLLDLYNESKEKS